MRTERQFRAYVLFFVFVISPFVAAVASPAQENPPNPGNTSQDSPPARVARLSFLKGDVSFLRAGVDQWSRAALNFPVTTGDRLYTDRGSRAELEVGPYAVRVAENTDLTITNLDNHILQIGLEQGTLQVSVYQLVSGDIVEVDTPNGALTLLESGTFRANVDPSGEFTAVSADSGSLEVTGGNLSQKLQTGQALKLTGHETIQAVSIPIPPLDSFDRWCEERDRRISASQSGRYVSHGIPGYADLDDYGRWEEVVDYGAVWYPTVVVVDWVPYRFGRWVWVMPWGWTWVEDEPWGFCPFHYGRWVRTGVAWGWVPGPVVVAPVYAPALVAFVGGPHFSVGVGIGGVSLTAWFPLGPGEPYFPWYHCREDYLREVNITNVRNVTNVTNITNITNVRYQYRTVAATAVRTDIFRTGQPVARQIVKLTPQQLERAQIIPHPPANPVLRSALPGKQVPAPPVRSRSLATASGHLSAATRATPSENRQPAPRSVNNPMPVERPSSIPPATGKSRTVPPLGTGRPFKPSPPRLITRNPPPPPHVPFVTQQRFMEQHPGRPLEPHQLESLRAGRAVEPMRDREFPPHIAPFPPARSSAPPRVEKSRRR